MENFPKLNLQLEDVNSVQSIDSIPGNLKNYCIAHFNFVISIFDITVKT